MKSKKKKILFINGHLNVGGIERSLVDLISSIDNTRYDIDLLLLENTGNYINQLPPHINVVFPNIQNAHGPIKKTLINNLKNHNYSNILYRIILFLALYINKKILIFLRPLLKISNFYDCAISYRGDFYTDILAYTINSNKKICWWHHGECIYNNESINRINKTWQHIDIIVTVSKGCKDIILSNFKYPSSKIRIIPNMINIEKIQSMAGYINPYSNIGTNIVTVATYTPEKHLEDIIIITIDLIKDYNLINFKWHIIGDGILFENIKSKVLNQHLEDYIILHGRKNNPYPYIKFADIYVHTSYIESQCLAVLEAMALKVPCIVRESLGPKEYIKNRYNGYLASHDIDSITKSIINIIKNGNDIDVIKRNAYKTVNDNYRPSIILDKFNKLINENHR